MSQLTKCCTCKKYVFGYGKCEKYKERIPDDIYLEEKECEDYDGSGKPEGKIGKNQSD